MAGRGGNANPLPGPSLTTASLGRRPVKLPLLRNGIIPRPEWYFSWFSREGVMRLGSFVCLLTLTVLAGLFWAAPAPADSSPPNDKLNKKIDNVSFKDTEGKTHALSDLQGKRAVVVVFLSFECPVSVSYSQPLADLAKDYADKGVAILGVCVQDDLSAEAVAKQAEECKLGFPVYKDEKSAAADAFKAVVAPEAFLLDHNFVLRYRGRIDNAWAARLKKNQQITEHSLKNAIDQLLAGKDVAEPATTAIGCSLRRQHEVKAEGPVT